MKIRYADNSPLPKSPIEGIFLAGPTPRSLSVKSWRLEALQLIESLNYQGEVCIPEHANWETNFHYDDQVEWEYAHLLHSRVILFWVPRNMQTLPGLTTNVEFGIWVGQHPEKIVYGRPPGAVGTNYLDWFYRKQMKDHYGEDGLIYTNLTDTIKCAVDIVNAFL